CARHGGSLRRCQNASSWWRSCAPGAASVSPCWRAAPWRTTASCARRWSRPAGRRTTSAPSLGASTCWTTSASRASPPSTPSSWSAAARAPTRSSSSAGSGPPCPGSWSSRSGRPRTPTRSCAERTTRPSSPPRRTSPSTCGRWASPRSGRPRRCGVTRVSGPCWARRAPTARRSWGSSSTAASPRRRSGAGGWSSTRCSPTSGADQRPFASPPPGVPAARMLDPLPDVDAGSAVRGQRLRHLPGVPGVVLEHAHDDVAAAHHPVGPELRPADRLLQRGDGPGVEAAFDDAERALERLRQLSGAEHVDEVVVAGAVVGGVRERRVLGAGLTGEVAQPEHALARQVADGRPQRPAVGAGPEGEVLVGQRRDRPYETLVERGPEAVDGADRELRHAARYTTCAAG